VSITNRIQETEERISGAEDTIENIDRTVKDNVKQRRGGKERGKREGRRDKRKHARVNLVLTY